MDDQVAVVMGIDPGTLVRPPVSPSFSYARLSISLRLNNIITVRDRLAFITVSEGRALIDLGVESSTGKGSKNVVSETKMRDCYYCRHEVLINVKEIINGNDTSANLQHTYLE